MSYPGKLELPSFLFRDEDFDNWFEEFLGTIGLEKAKNLGIKDDAWTLGLDESDITEESWPLVSQSLIKLPRKFIGSTWTGKLTYKPNQMVIEFGNNFKDSKAEQFVKTEYAVPLSDKSSAIEYKILKASKTLYPATMAKLAPKKPLTRLPLK
jgi:hypothetical protein